MLMLKESILKTFRCIYDAVFKNIPLIETVSRLANCSTLQIKNVLTIHEELKIYLKVGKNTKSQYYIGSFYLLSSIKQLFFNIHHCSDKERNIILAINEHIDKRSVKIHLLCFLRCYGCTSVFRFNNSCCTRLCSFLAY